LIIDGKVKVGVLACPNLPTSFKDPSSERGLLLYGVENGKAFQTPLNHHDLAQAEICQMKSVSHLSEATFCESVESGHSSHDQQSRISEILGIKTQSVRMDSQAKYATLTRGDADIYLRLPVSMTYEEKIWVSRL
jgi:3'(2'), 5'-bisphosphate nucleotidase